MVTLITRKHASWRARIPPVTRNPFPRQPIFYSRTFVLPDYSLCVLLFFRQRKDTTRNLASLLLEYFLILFAGCLIFRANGYLTMHRSCDMVCKYLVIFLSLEDYFKALVTLVSISLTICISLKDARDITTTTFTPVSLSYFSPACRVQKKYHLSTV